jgi:asparagine synthase (glutamine-hydrolysing)
VTRYNLPQLLRHLDRNSMAFSVECRVPFLDHRLIELAFTIPGNAKMHAGFGKYVLRRAMEDSLPDSIVWNRHKTGFGHAEQLWFFSAIDVEELRQGGLDKYLDVSELARRVARPGANQVQDYWLAYSLGLWLNEFAPQVSA